MAKYKNSLEINDRKAQLQKRCKEIIKQCREEVREMNEEEKEEVENAKSEIEQLKEELKALQQRLQEFDEIEKEIEDEEEVEEPKEEKEEEIKSNIRRKDMNKQKFSLLKAINDVVNNRNFDKATEAVINEGANEMRKAGLSTSGQIQLLTEERTITVANEHDNLVGVDVMSIEAPLRAKNVLIASGAKYLTNLKNDVVIPVMTGNNVEWADENGDATDGGATFTSVKLQPKRLTCFVDVSKSLLIQNDSVEQMLRNDIINAINTKLEETILSDLEKTNNRPAGVFNGREIASATTTFAQLTELESQVENANVLGETSYILSPQSKAVLRAMPKSSKNTQLVMEGGEIDGVKTFTTSNMKANHFIYGDMSNVVIAQFSNAYDIICDPYSKAKTNEIRLVIHAFYDCAVIRPEAIAVGKTV